MADLDLENLHGRRALLVEDNEINQMVASEMLQNMGMIVSIADNGDLAIQMMAHAGFDVVLMDIQMPGMNGYETTAKIRSDARFSFKNLPIIAMTAHALVGDRQIALDAGLNDYIAKPVDMMQLANTLLRWLAPMDTPVLNMRQVPKNAPDVLPSEILLCLDTTGALVRLGGNQIFYKRLLRLFQIDKADMVQEIRLALQSGDLVLTRRLAHNLKAVAGSIGASDLSEAARRFEQVIMVNEQNLFPEYLEQINSQMKMVLAALAYLEKDDPSTVYKPEISFSSNLSSLLPDLKRLYLLLIANDAKAVAVTDSLLEQVREAGLNNDLQDLGNFIYRYNFPQALKTLQTLAQNWQINLAEA